MRLGLIIVGGMAAGGMALIWARQADMLPVDFLPPVIDNTLTDFGFMKLSAAKTVDTSLLGNRNVQAMLRVIRQGEGTTDPMGYTRLFGGGQFSSMADHPRIVVKKSGYSSSAAGAYQAKIATWDETRDLMNLPDFSPRSQDLFALGRMAIRGALPDVLAGNFESAIKRINKEWASLPESPYGQPVLTMDKARAVFVAYGGDDQGGVA